MWQYIAKVAITAVLVVAIAELAKQRSLLAAVLASLPVTSLLAFVWLYVDTGDSMRVAALSQEILWLVLPSLILFLALPWLIRAGVNFWLSLGVASAATAVSYAAMIWALRRFGGGA